MAVDALSSDGSDQLAASLGVRNVLHEWRGFGAARRRAVEELDDCDYVVFLDSDEVFDARAVEAIRAWKASRPRLPYYRIRRRDLVHQRGATFVFRAEWRKRLVRRDAASWSDAMIVHEALPDGPTGTVDGYVEHDFLRDSAVRRLKNERYALLWALSAAEEGRAPKYPATERLAHFARNALLKGALLRGGVQGARIAWAVADYHAAKQRHLRRIREGAHAGLLELYREGRLAELFRAVNALDPALPGGTPAGASAFTSSSR